MSTLPLEQTDRERERERDRDRATITYKPLSPGQLALRRFRRNKLGIFGAILMSVFLFTAIFAPLIAPHTYDKTNLFKPTVQPGQLPEHPLGTDELGRDFLSRLMYGARTSLTVAGLVQVFVLILGVTLGFAAAWFGGIVDFLISRLLEVVGSLPGLLFQILIVILLKQTIDNSVLVVVVAIGLLAWPIYVRLVRAQVLTLKERDFVEATRSLGGDAWFIATRHVLPNIVSPLIVAVTSSIGLTGFITAESTLSLFGYGINDPIPSWGKMVGESVKFIQRFQYLAILPIVCLTFLILGVSFFGDGLRDALDPSSDRMNVK
jgi:ABC-type dipeptide/oligopeptide/nickel transport system permease subunit